MIDNLTATQARFPDAKRERLRGPTCRVAIPTVTFIRRSTNRPGWSVDPIEGALIEWDVTHLHRWRGADE